jgi:pimeloyl-ACP methyl ester carboxylesterase
MEISKFDWSLGEMGSKTTGARPLKIEISPNTDGEKFSLYYSFPEPSARKNRENILFIPGGPGSIPWLDQSEPRNKLELLESSHNIAYFHVRGTGFSILPPSNGYDRFLRADYVVKDIETLRTHLLGEETPWDAIWGESHGALIAQRYAKEYEHRVKKLILVAPPSRISSNTQDHRQEGIVANLLTILESYRGDAAPKADDATIKLTNDLDFLTNQTGEIGHKLKDVLAKLEERYGSINFVIDNYNDLKEDAEFSAYRYPEEFFKALRWLQFHGCPQGNVEFQPDTQRKQIDAAILISYCLILPAEHLRAFVEHLDTPGNPGIAFENTAAPVFMRPLPPDRRGAYIKRLQMALENIASDDEPRSLRAYWVFGVYDGLSRLVLNIMAKEIKKTGVFETDNIQQSITVPAAQDLANKMGIVPGQRIRPWNPGDYKHRVPTLILRGGADAATAGGQAESFYKDGLDNKNDSVLMEIPGMGHIWRTSMPMATFGGEKKPGWEVFQELAKKFLRKPSAFLKDHQVDEIIKSLGISPDELSQKGYREYKEIT